MFNIPGRGLDIEISGVGRLIEGFERARLPGFGVEIDTLIGGSGPPLLLLHGYPQTRLMWKAIAPALARRFTVIIPDLRGYGRSEKPEGGPNSVNYSKRVMAQDQLSIMAAAGFDAFHVAGHDRGARVAYRLALDHPGSVRRLALLDIVPTGDMWANANAASAMSYYHWYFLAQPYPLPETLIGEGARSFAETMLERLAGAGHVYDPECLEDYLACFANPTSLHATCEDYRAGWKVDRLHDEEDRGGKKINSPLLLLWSAQNNITRVDPIAIWRNWASDVRGSALPAGHFLCDECPTIVTDALQEFFSST